MRKLIWLSLMLFVLVGCRSKQYTQTVSTSDIREVKQEKLNPVVVPGDSAMIKALFQCDSLNRVLLVGYSENKSRGMFSDFSFLDGELRYKAETKHDTMYVKSTDYYYYSKKTLTIRKQIVKTVTVYKHKDVPVRGFFWYLGLFSSIYYVIKLILYINKKLTIV